MSDGILGTLILRISGRLAKQLTPSFPDVIPSTNISIEAKETDGATVVTRWLLPGSEATISMTVGKWRELAHCVMANAAKNSGPLSEADERLFEDAFRMTS